MRFKQFLEAKVKSYDHEPAATHDLVELLDRHCLQALRSAQAGNFIYRGSRSTLPAGVYNPGSGERKSQNTSNFYTIFLDTNPLNDEFPKRSKSFITTNNRYKAENYASGPILYCFPFDDVKIGLVDSDDFWDLRIDFDVLFSAGDSIADLNDFWEELIGDMLLKSSDIKSLADMISAIKSEHPATVANRLHRNGYLYGVNRSKISDEEIVKRFVASLPKAYSYKQLDCKLTTPDDIPDPDKGSCEMWFSGKCVMIPENILDEIREELGL